MSLKERKYLYEEVEVNGDLELDWATRNITGMDIETLQTFRIPQAMTYRPDLISLKFYGNFHMGWLIALHNDFLDPIRDFTIGRLIKIPDLDSYFRYYKTHSRRV